MNAFIQDFNKNQPSNLNEWLWQDRDLSDVTLTLATASAIVAEVPAAASKTSSVESNCRSSRARGTNKAATSAPAPPAAAVHGQPTTAAAGSYCRGTDVFHLHATVLCTNSTYFRARITTAVGGSGSKRRRCETMIAEIEADQLQAAASVLCFFYTSQLKGQEDGACSPELVLQMMQVADCWQAPLALTTLSTLLCKLDPDLFPATAVYTLPPGLQAPAFADARAHAKTCLLAVFGDATAVVSTPALLGRFLSLPHAAVLALLSSDTLVTDAEATVLLLLSEWCNGDRGEACTKEELWKLNGCIRYSRLSMPYLMELCEHLRTPLLTLEERMELLHFRTLSEPLQTELFELDHLANPSGWYLPHRLAPRHNAVPAVRMSFKIPEAEWYAFLQACKDTTVADDDLDLHALTSEAVYSQGFTWQLRLGKDRAGRLLCLIIVSGISSLLESSASIALHLGISCKRSVRVLGRTSYEDEVQSMNAGCVGSTHGVGNDCNVREGDTRSIMSKVWWQPHMVDGYITFVADITDIAS